MGLNTDTPVQLIRMAKLRASSRVAAQRASQLGAFEWGALLNTAISGAIGYKLQDLQQKRAQAQAEAMALQQAQAEAQARAQTRSIQTPSALTSRGMSRFIVPLAIGGLGIGVFMFLRNK